MTKRVTAFLPADLASELARRGSETGAPVSRMIVIAVREWVEKGEPAGYAGTQAGATSEEF